ncbi:transmembrane protein [Rhynchospora pubera]|uniref:Transmembrane protein n=1 Tax=Rhynchospora pubera TaxID=906938 RepID=A0AAV8FHY2_9POAL|nr:transmembrane protein [Rhynchospora pubera]KAJ4761728.1 transmembrane protein [Rhynchospora pubera]KAJ4790361.1 transmembrane protein [Rhynchospora pubera]KAJ4814207.1 transmembrane protein [Rhynchospora pubera]
MSKQPFGLGSPRSFPAYPRGDFDLESGLPHKIRKPKMSLSDPPTMIKSFPSRIQLLYRKHPVLLSLASLFVGVSILVFLSIYESRFRMMGFQRTDFLLSDPVQYPLAKLSNLVMVAGHSIYTSNKCGKFDGEDSWFLEPYQKHPGQVATFLAHIKEGVEAASKDEEALLLFSGGETRKDAGPRSEAQSYWAVAESEGWYGKEESVRSRALTEEHARDSFENLLFSVCRFRELTGRYPHNITVVSYDFKEERFAHLHRMAIGFPENRFLYLGTPATPSARDGAMKGESLVRSQFEQDPYGCLGSLHQKRLKRDPFHRTVPYPNGCPELKGLFSYCGPVPYPGSLPWTQ